VKYHVDGDLVPAEDASVSIRDRGFRYGDAAFETLRAYGGSLFKWGAHADRLRRTCDALGFAADVPNATDLRARIRETLSANNLDDAYVRLAVTRGVLPGKLTPAIDVDPTVVVEVKPLPRGGVESDPVWDGPARVRTADTRKIPDASIPADAKTHNYLNGILARLELQGTQADESLMLDGEGYVTEGATSNLFFVADDALCTPSESRPLLPGITRDVVLDLARDEGIPVNTGWYDLGDVHRADEAFLTNTTWEIRPLEAIDRVDIGGGPITDLLSRLFDERVERRCYDSDQLRESDR
jgi:branched-chain amino acid aminotransferase